jgi:hypothetical protein
MGGTRGKEWLPELDKILVRWAKDNNCKWIELTGRDGWTRTLPKISKAWKQEFTVYRRELDTELDTEKDVD